MGIYDITGADKATGVEKVTRIAAASRDHAEQLAQKRGILVSSVEEAVAPVEAKPDGPKSPQYFSLKLAAAGFNCLGIFSLAGSLLYPMQFHGASIMVALVALPVELSFAFVLFGLATCCEAVRLYMVRESAR